MTINNEFTATKKRVRIFMYEFDGYYEPSMGKTLETSIKEEGGFYVILASVIVVLSLLILGLDLAISPITGLRHFLSSVKTNTSQTDFSSMDTTFKRESLTAPRNHFRDPSSRRIDERRDNFSPPFQEPVRQSVRGHPNSPVSLETSFTSSSNLRPREYWL